MATIIDEAQVESRMVTEDGAVGLRYKTLFGPVPGRRLNSNLVVVEPGGITRAHKHEWEQVNYILAGTGVLKTGDGSVVPVGTGKAVHISGGEIHWFENTGSEPMKLFGVLGPMPPEEEDEKLYPVLNQLAEQEMGRGD